MGARRQRHLRWFLARTRRSAFQPAFRPVRHRREPELCRRALDLRRLLSACRSGQPYRRAAARSCRRHCVPGRRTVLLLLMEIDRTPQEGSCEPPLSPTQRGCVMKSTQTFALATLASAVALAATVAEAQTNVPKPTYKFEKCYGVVKAGKNDCFS